MKIERTVGVVRRRERDGGRERERDHEEEESVRERKSRRGREERLAKKRAREEIENMKIERTQQA